jgi:hypothetical protein
LIDKANAEERFMLMSLQQLAEASSQLVTAALIDLCENDNNNNAAHGFDSGSLSQDMTFQHMFNNAGTIEYYCSIHPYNDGKSNRISLVKKFMGEIIWCLLLSAIDNSPFVVSPIRHNNRWTVDDNICLGYG